MASNKDVKLIIRAQDKASATLDTVAQSLGKVEKAQAGAAKTAKDTDNNFEALGDEVARLSKQLDGLRELGAVSRTLTSLRETVQSMEKGIRESAGQFDRFAKEAQDAAGQIVNLRAQAESLSQAFDRQKTQTDEARKATLKGSEATREMVKAKKELDRLTAKGADVSAIQAATQAYERAAATVERNKAVHNSLQGELEQTKRAMADTNAAITAQEKVYRSAISAAERHAEANRQGKTSLEQLEKGFSEVEGRAIAAAKGLGAASLAEDDLRASADATTQALNKNEAALRAMQRYSTGSANGFADPKTAAALRQQREEIERARQAWKALEDDVRRQAVAMRQTEQPTKAQAEALRQTVAAARAAKDETRNLEAALARLQGSMRSSFSEWERGSQSIRRYAQAVRSIPEAPRSSGWTGFFGAFNNGSRQSLSLVQRLRGELLSLATAYLGLYQAINQVGGVITAYQKLEAAQNRLGVVFEQNASATAKELGFLERQAARLGIEFGLLSDQYSKFAVAARTANFSIASTREIFMSVAESGRVAKLSADQMGGIFLALEQMISKGKIQSEELRRQLGDRLPGAFSIMAKALGVSTAALDDMMKKGQVIANEDTLLKFAEELQRQFGAQLPAALTSTTTKLGQFANAIYQAQLRVGEGGFIEGLNKALEEANKWFASREGRDFFLSLGAALGKFMVLLAELPKNIDLVIRVIQILISLKMAQWVMGVVSNIQKMEIATKASAVQFQTWGAVATAAGARLTALKTSFLASVGAITTFRTSAASAGAALAAIPARVNVARAALTAFNGALAASARAFNILLAAMGGIPGVLITIGTLLASELIGRWAGGVEDATYKMDEHKRIVGEVLTAYESLADKTGEWQKSIQNVNREQAETNFLAQVDLYKKAVDELNAKINSERSNAPRWFNVDNAEIRKVRELIDTFEYGKTDISDFADALINLNSEIGDVDAKKLILEIIAITQKALEAEGRMDEAAAVAKAMGSVLESLGLSAEEAAEVLRDMSDATDEASDSLGNGVNHVDNFKNSLDELKGLVPSVAAEMKKLQDYSKLDAAGLKAAMDVLRLPLGQQLQAAGDVLSMWGRGRTDLNLANIDTTPLVSSLDTNSAELRAFYEQIKGSANLFSRNPNSPGAATLNTAAWQNANLTTIETASGIKTQVHKAAAAAFQGFINELEATGYNIRQFGGFNVRNKVGGTTLSEHAFGNAIDINWDMNPFADKLITDLPKEIGLMAAKYGLSWGGDWRNKKDAMHFEYTGQTPPGLERATAFQLEQQKQTTQELQKQNNLRADSVAKLDAELALGRLQALGDERRVAIREALNAATAKGITDNATLWQIAEKAGELWDQKNAARVAEQQKQTEQRLADLEQENVWQGMINEGKERQVAIERALAEAIKADPSLENDKERLALLEAEIARNYDLANAEKNRYAEQEAAEKRVNDLLEYRRTLQETLRLQLEQGDAAGAEQTKIALEGVNRELLAAIDNAIAMWQAIGGEGADMAIAKLRQTKLEIAAAKTQMGLFGLSAQQWQGIMQNFASGLTGVFDKFARAIANGENAIEALGQAFLEFAANFLIEIGKMIIQQAILNALQGFMGGGFGGGGGFGLPFGHTGGLVGAKTIGSGNARKNMLANLPYFHDGGIVGLKPDETIAVLRQGEEVLTENDPRHMFNQGGQSPSQPEVNLRVINAFDSGEVVSEGMNTPVGEQTFINQVKKNADTINSILGR